MDMTDQLAKALRGLHYAAGAIFDDERFASMGLSKDAAAYLARKRAEAREALDAYDADRDDDRDDDRKLHWYSPPQ